MARKNGSLPFALRERPSLRFAPACFAQPSGCVRRAKSRRENRPPGVTGRPRDVPGSPQPSQAASEARRIRAHGEPARARGGPGASQLAQEAAPRPRSRRPWWAPPPLLPPRSLRSPREDPTSISSGTPSTTTHPTPNQRQSVSIRVHPCSRGKKGPPPLVHSVPEISCVTRLSFGRGSEGAYARVGVLGGRASLVSRGAPRVRAVELAEASYYEPPRHRARPAKDARPGHKQDACGHLGVGSRYAPVGRALLCREMGHITGHPSRSVKSHHSLAGLAWPTPGRSSMSPRPTTAVRSRGSAVGREGPETRVPPWPRAPRWLGFRRGAPGTSGAVDLPS